MNPGWLLLIVLVMFYLMPALMIVGGVISILWPRAAWYANVGWKIRGAEPTIVALWMHRIGGLFGCLFGALFLMIVIHVLPVTFGPKPQPIAPAQAPPAPLPK